MKYHTYVSRIREHNQEVLDVVSCRVSLAHIAHGGCAIPSKTPPLRGAWTRQQLAKWRHYNRRETSKTTLTSFTSPSLAHFISHFSLWWRPRPLQRHPLFYPLRAFLSNPSSAFSSSVALFPPPP